MQLGVTILASLKLQRTYIMDTQDSQKSLYNLFGRFMSRLSQIELYEDITPDPTSKLWFDGIKENIQTYPPNESLPFIGELIDRVSLLLKDSPKIRRAVQKVQDQITPKGLFGENIIGDKIRVREATNMVMGQLKQELIGYKKILETINEILLDNVQAFGNSGSDDRLQFNLALPELCGILAVMKSANVIPSQTLNTDITRTVQKYFRTSQGGGQGKNSVSKKLNLNEIPFDRVIELFQTMIEETKRLKEEAK